MSWTMLDSSMLQAAAYQDQLCALLLRFHGGAVYAYLNAPASLYQHLLQADSKGRYFNSAIRNRFQAVLISPALSRSRP